MIATSGRILVPTGMRMTDLRTLIRLQTWLSPAFPTGAFSYSHGLEQAIKDETIFDQETLRDWLTSLIVQGSGWNDAVLLTASWRAANDTKELAEIAELAEAMSISKERHLETSAQGTAFLKAADAWPGDLAMPDLCTLSVAVGAVAGRQSVDLKATLSAYLHAFCSNQVQAALRLMPLGQQGGVAVLAQLEEVILDVALKASDADLSNLGSTSLMADIAAMNHEQLPSRIFRS